MYAPPTKFLVGVVSLVLSAFVLVACGTTGAPPLSGDRLHGYHDFLTKPHYRAFAMGGNPEYGGVGWAWNAASPDAAMERALAACERARMKTEAIDRCEVYTIGHITVAGMNSEQLAQAIALYKADELATNADLEERLPDLADKR